MIGRSDFNEQIFIQNLLFNSFNCESLLNFLHCSGQGVPTSPMIVESNPYKRGRFTPPQQQQQAGQTQQSKSAAQAQDKQQQNKAAAGGKGTRPKRGKYRNYDRDSLVEAVRAVQRGEMSVHRAGSYYGVPHSTLEYKVKERHLMRPRKRSVTPDNYLTL